MESCGRFHGPISNLLNLDETHVQYGRNRHCVGWTYLGDGGKRATPTVKIPEIESAQGPLRIASLRATVGSVVASGSLP